MSMAPPGKFSGKFYIILGNIPKKKKDYELKKFVERSGIAVEDAHVHPNLGCGYVSVRGGLEGGPFFQLGKWLEQAEWEGKTLQVDMRNYDQETALGPGFHPSLKSPTGRSRSSNHSPTSPNGSSSMSPGAYRVQYAQYQPQAQVPVSPAYGTVQSGYAQQYTYINNPMTYSAPTMQAPAYATNHMSQVITSPYQYADPSQFQSAPALAQQQVPMTYSQTSYCTGSPTAIMQQPAAQARPANLGTVPILHRLLHCTRVQGCNSKGEISRKVLSVLSSKEVSPIDHIWIPTRSQDGSEKGHALILMRTEGLANKVVSKLKDVKITGKDGKKRSAKFKIAQDGVSDGDLAQMNAGDNLAGQMNSMSLQSPVTSRTPEEATEQSGCDDSIAMSKTPSIESAPNIAAQDDGIPASGRRRSSLPIVDGRSLQAKMFEKGEKESKSSKDREKSSRHGHHSSSHHTSSSKTSGSSGSKKSRK